MAVIVLDQLEGYPDAHFVEDAAVVTPDVAVITNPGASFAQGRSPDPSRRPWNIFAKSSGFSRREPSTAAMC
jgi:hypothetical protein